MQNTFEAAIKQMIQKAVFSAYQIEISPTQIKVDTPPDKKMGDIAIPLGFLLTKTLKKPPFDIVTEMAEKIKSIPEIRAAEPAKPGFLNIFLSNAFFENCAKGIFADVSAFDFEPKEKKIFLEYVSANPTGPLHIGHGRWAALGDSIARLLKKTGYSVFCEFYVNDAGNQIENLKRTVAALKNNQPVPEDGYHGEYVKECLTSDLEPSQFFLEKQKQVLKKFRVVFDSYYSEKALHQSGAIPKAIEVLKEHGHIYEQEGACWFKSTAYGDDKDRVLKKTDGKYTYFAPDIAYHLTKIERGGEWLIDILGADHHGYVKRLTAAVMALSEKKARMDILIGQLVNLFRNGEPVRMSKRTGDMITLEEVIDEIGADALRYILVSKKHTQPIDFDLEVIKKQNSENPVFYIQYAFARINSILKNTGAEIDLNSIQLKAMTDSEKELLLSVIRFKDEIEQAAQALDPQKLSAYLLNIAGLFHTFYEKNRVLNNGEVIKYRVFLILLVAKVLKEGLSLLGIESPEKM